MRDPRCKAEDRHGQAGRSNEHDDSNHRKGDGEEEYVEEPRKGDHICYISDSRQAGFAFCEIALDEKRGETIRQIV
jgi:hypothetical protein